MIRTSMCLAVIVVLTVSISAEAGTVVWISDGFDGVYHGRQNDQSFVDLLTGHGYTVIRKDYTAGAEDSFRGPLDSAQKALLNDADLVIDMTTMGIANASARKGHGDRSGA